LSEHPYIRVVYQLKEISATYGMDILYEYVEIVRKRGASLKYSSGNYQTDISLARIDGSILNNLQEHQSVAAYEKLVAAKPKERYKLIMRGEVVPPARST
jgi:hypothetical protein